MTLIMVTNGSAAVWGLGYGGNNVWKMKKSNSNPVSPPPPWQTNAVNEM